MRAWIKIQLVIFLSVIWHTVSSSRSSQRQHKQQSGALVVLWSSGSGGNDSWTNLLPEEIFWSTASSVVRLNCPSVSSTVFSNNKTVIYTLEMRLAVLSKAYLWLDLRYFVFPLPIWFLLKNVISVCLEPMAKRFWNRCQFLLLLFFCFVFTDIFLSVQYITSQYSLPVWMTVRLIKSSKGRRMKKN